MQSSSPHLIIVAHALAPGPGGPEAHVNSELLRALSRHWDGTVAVISGGDEPTLEDGQPVSQLEGWSTYSLPTFNTKRYPTALSRFLKRAAVASRAGSIPGKVVNRLAFLASGQGAKMLSWDLATNYVLTHEIAGHPGSFVWSRALPWASIQAPLRVRRKQPFYWILNLNDPFPPGLWSGLMHVSPRAESAIRRKFTEVLEKADALTFPCARLADMELRSFSKMREVPTPIFPHICPLLEALPNGRQTRADRTLRIAFAGNLRRNRRSEGLTRALEQLSRSEPALLSDLHLHFHLSRIDSQIRTYVEDLPVNASLTVGDFDSSLIGKLQGEDVLLNLEASVDEPLLLTKLVNYLAVERTIWAIAAPGGTTWGVLENHDCHFRSPINDVEAIAQTLRSIHKKWSVGALEQFQQPTELRVRFSGETQIRDLRTLTTYLEEAPPGTRERSVSRPKFPDWP